MSALADTESDARHWYEREYAPVFYSIDRADPAVIRTFYLDDYRVHPDAGGPTTQDANSEQAWRNWVEGLKSAGWVGSALEWIDVEALNQSTVTIRARWSNRDAQGPTEDTCDWYLASRHARGWKFTNYVQVDCSLYASSKPRHTLP